MRYTWLSPLALGLLLALLLWNGIGAGARYVLDNQPADEVAAVQLVETTLRPGERVQFALPPDISLDKYSSISSHAASGDTQASYLLQAGDNPPAGGTIIGRAGRFTLYRLAR
jgi:hypothetical protein